MRGTDTGSTVLDGLAVRGSVTASVVGGAEQNEENVLCDRELAKVVANHLRLDLHLVELLAGVDANDAANHLGDDNHVAEMGLDEVGLLVGLGLLLGLAQLLDQAHRLALETAVDPAASTGVDDIAELIGSEVKETGRYVSGVVSASNPIVSSRYPSFQLPFWQPRHFPSQPCTKAKTESERIGWTYASRSIPL